MSINYFIILHVIAKLDLKTMECADIARAVILLGESLWENVDDMMRNGQVGFRGRLYISSQMDNLLTTRLEFF